MLKKVVRTGGNKFKKKNLENNKKLNKTTVCNREGKIGPHRATVSKTG